MRCPHCGFEDPEEYVYCSECGQYRNPTPAPGASASPFAGAAGAHVPPVAPAISDPRLGFPGDAPPADGPAARLVGLEGRVHAQEFVLDRPDMRIGRQSDCEIVIPEQSVSRLHARIRRVPGGYVVEDANSSNGTWVNGVRLEGPRALADRDVIRIGNAAFDFRIDEPAPHLPPGPMTMVSDIGDDPSPFGDDAFRNVPPPVAVVPIPPVPPSPTPHPSERSTPYPRGAGTPDRFEAPLPSPGRPAARPAPVTAPPVSGPGGGAAGDLRADLDDLERDLGPFIERLTSLAASVRTIRAGLEGAPGHAPSPALRALAAELEADGGIERFRDLRALLDQLRVTPTDVKVLLQLSDELPSIERLLRFYIRALDLLRDLDRA